MAELAMLEEWLSQREPETPLEEWELDQLAVVTARTVRRVRELREAVAGEPGARWVREPGCVAVGDEVVLSVAGEEIRLKIGSYLVSVQRAADGWVSHRTPLAALVLGARVGATLRGLVAGREVAVTVVSTTPVVES